MLGLHLRRIATAVAIAFLTSAVASSGTLAADLEKVSVLIDWKATPSHSGFHIAKAIGAFERRGIDATIIEGNGAIVSAQLIGIGNQYWIGSCSGSATVIGRSRGLPIKSIATYYHNVPTVLYSRVDTPITKPADLVGKKIGLITGSITVDEYRAMVAANHIDRSKINEVNVGWDVAPLLTKQVDGLMDYAELTPVELELRGIKIDQLRLADYGVKAYSLNLIVNEAAWKDPKKKATALKVAEAVKEGYQFIHDNPEKAAEIFFKLYPEKSEPFLKRSMPVVAKQLEPGPVGSQTREGWQTTIDTLSSLGLLAGKVSVDDVAVQP